MTPLVSISEILLGARRCIEIAAVDPAAPGLSVSLRLRLDRGVAPVAAAAFSSMFLPSCAPAALEDLAEVFEAALRRVAVFLEDHAERQRVEGHLREAWAAECGRVRGRWDRSAWTGRELRLLRAADRRLVSGFVAPRTDLGAPGEIGFWRDKQGAWTAGEIAAVEDVAIVADIQAGASAHEIISLISGGGSAHPSFRPVLLASMMGGNAPRPMAVFRPGTAACRSTRQIVSGAGLEGYFNAPASGLQHLSLGYSGQGPALSIFEESDRIRICDLRQSRWSFSSREAFERSIAAWVELLADLDVELRCLGEPGKSIVKASHTRLEAIEERVGRLPHADKGFVLAVLGRAYSAAWKKIPS